MNTELGSETLLEGKLFDVVLRSYERPDGRRYERQVLVHPGAVGIVAYDEHAVFLVRQPREAVGEDSLLEIPAGTMDVEGESELQCAQRELREEAGLVATDWSVLRSFYPAPGWGDTKTTLFLASGLSEVEAEPSPGEQIELLPWPLSDLEGAMAEAKDAKTLISLLLLRDRLASKAA